MLRCFNSQHVRLHDLFPTHDCHHQNSSWFAKLPDHHVRIGISRSVQVGTYLDFQPLAPGPWFRNCETPEEYRRRYFSEVLARLEPKTVVADLALMADGDIPVLLCWEAPPPDERWCHRALVSVWLFDELGLQICELGHEIFWASAADLPPVVGFPRFPSANEPCPPVG